MLSGNSQLGRQYTLDTTLPAVREGSRRDPEASPSAASQGWNVVMVLDGLNSNAVVRKYTWGLDLSQSIHGAGGIGGLLACEEPQAVGDPKRYWFMYDANGNVGQVLDATDTDNITIAAHYEYDPYGNVIHSSGPYKDANPIRFSTKWFDEETDLGYWGYRYYSPRLGRWMSRDPIGEDGGANLQSFLDNDPIQNVDSLGLVPVWLEQMVKEYGYQLWREYVVTAPHWQQVMDDWYYERGPQNRTYSGIRDPRCQDIVFNPGFRKLLNCWIASQRGVTVPSGPWTVNKSGFSWRYTYDTDTAAGGPAAYTPATHFLGSYSATVTDLGPVRPGGTRHYYQIDITNTSGWTSGTRLPGFAQKIRSKFGINGTSVFYNHDRGGARYTPSRGGTIVNNYSFKMTEDSCAPCVLP